MVRKNSSCDRQTFIKNTLYIGLDIHFIYVRDVHARRFGMLINILLYEKNNALFCSVYINKSKFYFFKSNSHRNRAYLFKLLNSKKVKLKMF